MEEKPVAAYYRVSLARDNMVAPQLYEDEIRRYCSYKKLHLAEVYSDIDLSAFRGAKARPSLEELVKRRKDYSAVIVPKLSRFGRSMKELIRLFDLFDRDRIPLVFLDMNLDTSTSQGRLLRHIIAAFAEYESDVKADYTRANHRRIRAEGKAWGTPPFGLKRIGAGEWAIDEDKAPVIRAVFRSYTDGNSAMGIADELNTLGITTAKGHLWKPQAIGKLIDNPAYAAMSLVDDGFVPAQWPAIVPQDVWQEARRRRQADPRRRGNLGVARPRSAYLLSGLVWCGQCGRRMSHTTSTRKSQDVYHCSGDWYGWKQCPNARVYDYLAHDFVRDAFLKHCVFTILTETGARAGSPRIVWNEATLPEQQRLLGLVIERIDMTPLPEKIPRTEWPTTLRHHLDITWKAQSPVGGEVAVVAEPPPPPAGRTIKVSRGRAQMVRARDLAALIAEDSLSPLPTARRDLPSAAGKSWAEWTREVREYEWALRARASGSVKSKGSS